MNPKSLINVLLCLSITQGYSQDVEQTIKETKKNFKEDPVNVQGSIGASAVYYQPRGIAPRRDPFYWAINANLNLSLLNKISVPITAVFTQQDKNYSHGLDKFSQPFNQFGISPRYRWLTVHAGFRTMEFSEFTLSGAMFLGGGVEIKPEKSIISVSGVYGRFVKAVPKGGIDGIVVSLPAYQRIGGGAKVKIGNQENYSEIILLKLKDDIHSIPFDTNLNITPQENEVIGIGGKKRLTDWVTVSGDFSYSMFTKNLYEDVTKVNGFTYVNQIYEPRPSSQFNKAINCALEFSPGNVQLGLRYKRIDPDYRSLGCVFLTNDVEEISVNSAFALFKNRLSINIAGGLQKNNLDRIQIATTQRLIGSLNLSYNLTENFNVNGNYSNFSSNTRVVRDAFTDSVKLIQLTQSAGFNSTLGFGKRSLKHTLSSSSTFQESGGNKQSLNTFINQTLSYNASHLPSGFGINFSLLYNLSQNSGYGNNEGFGPCLGVQKVLLNNKLRIQGNIGFQEVSLNHKLTSRNANALASLNLLLDKNQTLKADFSYLEKIALSEGVQEFSEWRTSIGYVYRFTVNRKNTKSL